MTYSQRNCNLQSEVAIWTVYHLVSLKRRQFCWISFIQTWNARIVFSPFWGLFFFWLTSLFLCESKKKANIFLSFALGRPVWTRSIKKKITCDSHKSCLSPQIRSTTQVCRSSQRLTAGSQINVSPVAPFVYDSIAFPGDSGRSFCKQSDRLKQAMGGGGYFSDDWPHQRFTTRLKQKASQTHTQTVVFDKKP